MLALPLLWLGCAIAALVYSQQQHIPWNLALKALPAFLLEASFYFALGQERWRARLEKLSPVVVALVLTAAAAAPYCAASLAFGTFRWQALGVIAGLAAVASFWYAVLPRTAGTDILFLLLMTVVFVANLAPMQYVNPHTKLRLDVLGKVMWIRTGAFAMLSVRRVKGVGFGFWPGRREWMIGLSYFLMFLPVAAGVAWAIGYARPHLPPPGWDKTTVLALGTFFGALWVLAVSEEFFFRGLLQQWMGEWLGNAWLGLVVTSVLFGSAHLWLHAFPNWRTAILAGIMGVFCGLAFRRASSIRASMVTHALTVTVVKLFFS
jgi:membrane protease YdiL (CAAX protease family)